MTRSHRWTKEEVSIALREDISTADKMKLLGVSAKAISRVRSRVNKGDVIGDVRFNAIGRTVLAKTCVRCGLLMDGKSFYEGKRNGLTYLVPYCRWCHDKHGKRLDQVDSRHVKNQEISCLTADRKGYPYLQSDHDIASDMSMTVMQKAIAARRTYEGMRTFLFKYGYSHQILGDKTESQWRIEFKEEL